MLNPYKNYIQVIQDSVEELESGLAMPERGGDLPMSGVVVSVSFDNTTPIRKGQRVWYRAYAGEVVNYEGVEYRMINERDLVAWEDLGKGVK